MFVILQWNILRINIGIDLQQEISSLHICVNLLQITYFKNYYCMPS